MPVFDMGTGLSTLVTGAQQVLTTASTVAGNVNAIANGLNSLRNVTNVGQAIGALTGTVQSVSKLAGTLSTLTDPKKLSALLRGKNLPPGGEFSSSETAKAFMSSREVTTDWRVQLSIPWAFGESPILTPLLYSNYALIFPYTPSITISSTANYDEQSVTHQNYQFIYYQNSKSDQIQIQAPFNVEDNEQGCYWIAAVHFLRSVTKMFVGDDTYAGNPPPICRLKGYGQYVFNDIPVVVRSFSIDLPQDVNYIEATGNGQTSWVPVKSTLNISLQPIYSRTAARKFSLQKFVEGGYAGREYV